ncbi:hypothetical protein [Sorangium sp. So ce1078]|uniref:hypothetical protein n=1 Tax=Sorangium sp. So ce1078 TaxID=3133329 RepID=UPI003F5F8E09
MAPLDGMDVGFVDGAGNLWGIPGHETTVALRATNILGANGPTPGFSGFEYSLPSRETFFELRHRY